MIGYSTSDEGTTIRYKCRKWLQPVGLILCVASIPDYLPQLETVTRITGGLGLFMYFYPVFENFYFMFFIFDKAKKNSRIVYQKNWGQYNKLIEELVVKK